MTRILRMSNGVPIRTIRSIRVSRGLLPLLATVLLMSSACGRKTPVRPPEFVAPAAVTDLTAANTSAGVAVSWERPKQTADGQRLLDLDAFAVERALPGLPFGFLARIQIPDRDRLRQQKRFTYVDEHTLLGEAYRYRVFAVTLDGYVSAPSNVVDVVRQLPTVTPTPAPTATAAPAR
jgi:hypothetical protein